MKAFTTNKGSLDGEGEAQSETIELVWSLVNKKQVLESEQWPNIDNGRVDIYGFDDVFKMTRRLEELPWEATMTPAEYGSEERKAARKKLLTLNFRFKDEYRQSTARDIFGKLTRPGGVTLAKEDLMKVTLAKEDLMKAFTTNKGSLDGEGEAQSETIEMVWSLVIKKQVLASEQWPNIDNGRVDIYGFDDVFNMTRRLEELHRELEELHREL